MYLAKELGYTYGELCERITPEEYRMWLAFYEVEAQAQEESERKARRR
jgi:hypothetical protein